MTADKPSNQQERPWREPVRAIVSVYSGLKEPAPALFDDLAAAEKVLHELLREMPLVHFSPLDALSATGSDGREEPGSRHAPGSGRVLERPAESGSAWPHSAPPQSLPAADDSRARRRAVARETDDPVGQPPIVSFRQGSLSSDSAARLSPLSGDATVDGSATAARLRVPEPPPEKRGEGEPRPDKEHRTVPFDRGDSGPQAADAGTRPEGRSSGSGTPTESLLRGLAEDVFGKRVMRRASTDSAGSPHAAPPAAPQIPSLRPGQDEHGGGVASLRSMVEPLLVEGARRGESPPGDGDGGSPGSPPAQGREQPGMVTHPVFDLLAGSGERSAGWPGPVPGRSGAGTEITEAESGLYAEADTYAALVNDVLARQARRHGVDLS